ncbi:duf833 domain-containing protein [Stemphylium lycopersici]|nr:duf833 domain-containing protein [Stemphylium lycopersici]
MCIAILTTAHPDYPFILLNNRDEYLHRPTAEATWWPSPNEHVLGGYDLHRPAHGTWLGVTRQGRIAVLTNYREEDQSIVEGARSRGVIPNAWLKSDPAKKESTDEFAKRMIEEDGVEGVGGFSLCYGFVQDVIKGKGLAIVSNRTPDVQGVIHLLQKPDETKALSNAAYSDRSWPKVIKGEDWTRTAIAASVAAHESRHQLIHRLLDILSTNTMPQKKENEEWDMYLNQLRHSVFIPAIGRDHLDEHKMPAHEVGDVVKNKAVDATSGCYGTQKSIVVLCDRQGKVTYFERTFYDGDARPIEKGKGDRMFEYQIEGTLIATPSGPFLFSQDSTPDSDFTNNYSRQVHTLITAAMCIVFFNSHPENRRQHCVVQYHCAHEGCPGLFESHHKFLLESSCADCGECLKEDGVQVDPDVVPVRYYSPVEHFEIECVGLEGYVRVVKRGEEANGKGGDGGGGGWAKYMDLGESGSAEKRKEEDGEEMAGEEDDWRSYKSLSDVDSVTSHWRLDEVDTSPEPVFDAVSSPARQQEPDLYEEELRAPSTRQSPYEADPKETHGASVAYQPTVRSPSPETTMHRNLVNEQLAKLPRHIAHTREHSPSAFDTTGSLAAGSPAPRAPPAPSATPGQQWFYSPPSLHGLPGLYPPPGLHPQSHPPPDAGVYHHDSRIVYTTVAELIDLGKWCSTLLPHLGHRPPKMASLPPQRPTSQHRPSQPAESSSPQQDQADRTNSLSSHSIDSQTLLLNTPPAQQTIPGLHEQQEAPAQHAAPQQEEDDEPRKCWICFNDETEDDETTSEWRNPCACSLVAHEKCLLDWIADMEAPNVRRRAGTSAGKILCPQCKSEIKLQRPRSYVVDAVRGVERLAGSLLLPGFALATGTALYSTLTLSGTATIYQIFGTEDALQILGPLYETPDRRVDSVVLQWLEHLRQHWRLDLGLPLIPTVLVASRTSFADSFLPFLPLIFFVSSGQPNDEMLQLEWPPSAAFSFAALPYIRGMYNAYYERVWLPREQQWLKEIQPRAGEDTGADGQIQDDHDHDHDHEGDAEVVEEVEIELDFDIFADWNGGDADNNDAPENPRGPLAHEPQPEQDENDDEEDAEVPNLVNVGPQLNPAPPPNVPMQPPAQRPRRVRRERGVTFSTTSLADTILGALIFPTIAAAMGELLRLTLPTAWVTPATGSPAVSWLGGWLSNGGKVGDNDDYEDFYRYTSGRWLWDEQEQLRKRYRRFNVPALCQIACESVGARECTSMSKMAEGESNKVFRLVMDNGEVVIARVPMPNIGPTGLIMASEVASMDFARTVLEIPVPKVLAWSGVVENPVGSEYMLMEEARGVRLKELWDDMEFTNVVKVIEDVAAIHSKFSAVEFTRHGNLYLANDAFTGCEKAVVASDVPQSLKQDVETRFVIGPVTEKDFWHAEQASVSIDRGPWTSPASYLEAIGKREIAWLTQHAQHTKSKPQKDLTFVSKDQHDPSAHIALYEKFLKIAPYLVPEGRLSSPTLWQRDMTHNIFVQDNRISSVIDWRDCRIGPQFLQARHPQLVRYSGEMMTDLPEDFETLTDKEEEARIWSQVEKTLVLLTYETHSKHLSALLEQIERVPQMQNRRDTVDMSGSTWEGSLIPLRQCLIRVARHWDEIAPDNPCPIDFTAEEIEEHHRDGEGWNEDADFWDRMQGFVGRDGWTAHGNYDRALEVFADIKDRARQTCSGKEWLKFDKATRWPETRR